MKRLKLDLDELDQRARILVFREKERDSTATFWWNHFAIQQWRRGIIKRLEAELGDLQYKWAKIAYQVKHGHVRGTTLNRYRKEIDSRSGSIIENIRQVDRGEWDELAKPE